MDGLLVIDKPVGPTSHDVVARVRRVFGGRRVGHTGTLDPMASGVLPLLLGRATRLARFLDTDGKSYDATIRLGISTDTGDANGQPIGSRYEGPLPTRETIERMLDRFRGTFLQQPPAFSAKKIDGRRSYRLARARARALQGTEDVQDEPAALPVPAPTLPAPVSVTVHTLEITAIEGDLVMVRVTCAGGFYVRSLAHDLGEALSTGAHLTALRRSRASGVSLADAIPLDAIEDAAGGAQRGRNGLVPLRDLLRDLQVLVLTPGGVKRAATGCDLGPADALQAFPAGAPRPSVHFRLMDEAGELVGIAQGTPAGLLHPVVVLM